MTTVSTHLFIKPFFTNSLFQKKINNETIKPDIKIQSPVFDGDSYIRPSCVLLQIFLLMFYSYGVENVASLFIVYKIYILSREILE